MMLLLADSFSKLSTALGEKGLDSKTEWPKFAGDSKKFCAWYLSIMAQLSIHPWQELYDHHTNDVIASTTNTSLNGKLYAKLLVCLEGQALQDIVSRPLLCANGILLLQELVQSYRPKNVPEIIAAKLENFGHIQNDPPLNPLTVTTIDFMSYLMIYVMQMIPYQLKAPCVIFSLPLVMNSNLSRTFTVLEIFQLHGNLHIGQRYSFFVGILIIL
jgi:hypothetical protein